MKIENIVIDVPATLGNAFVAEEVRERTITHGGKKVNDPANVVVSVRCVDRRAWANVVVPVDGNHVGPVGKYHMPVRLVMPTISLYDYTATDGVRRMGASYRAVAIEPLDGSTN